MPVSRHRGDSVVEAIEQERRKGGRDGRARLSARDGRTTGKTADADGQGTRSEKGCFVGWGFLQFLFRFGARNGVAGYVGIKTAEIGSA